jgi:hypothetical protein
VELPSFPSSSDDIALGNGMADVSVDGKLRLLYCRTCKTIEELPDFSGPPEYDTLLQVLSERHRSPAGDSHVGNLFDVDIQVWANDDARREIIRQIKGGGSKGLDEFDAAFYDTRNTFFEDAAECYSRHLRPKAACPDWMSDRMILLPDTKSERKSEGLAAPAKAPGHKVHLCDFCVVKRYYARRINEQKGLL